MDPQLTPCDGGVFSLPQDDTELLPARAKACAKLILIGEHAVVYGSRGLAIPLPTLSTSLHLVPSPGSHRRVAYFAGHLVPDTVAGIFSDALANFTDKSCGFEIRGESTIPLGAGLGSSAALCVGAVRLLASALSLDENLSTEEVASFANQLERRFHGNPSGLDTTVIAHESPVLFRRGVPGQTVEFSEKKRGRWHFVLVDSMERAATREMIEAARPHLSGSAGQALVRGMDGLVGMTLEAMKAGDEATVGLAMLEAHKILARIGVVTEALGAIVDRALAAGALGAKVTGAGGGGQVLILFSESGVDAGLSALIEQFGQQRIREVFL